MNAAIFEEQLRSILDEFNQLKNRSQHDDLSDLPKDDRQAVVTRAIAAIHRIAGRDSAYVKEVNRLLQSMPLLHVHTTSIMGVAKALLDDIQAGYLLGLVEIVHADVFSDFLDMAKHLCDSGYKDASAVIAGSTLETHLRALCQKAGIPVEITKTNGDLVPKKADAMNSDLAAATVYSKLDQKNVTAWLDLRNKSAHGYYSEYTQDQAAPTDYGRSRFHYAQPSLIRAPDPPRATAVANIDRSVQPGMIFTTFRQMASGSRERNPAGSLPRRCELPR